MKRLKTIKIDSSFPSAIELEMALNNDWQIIDKTIAGRYILYILQKIDEDPDVGKTSDSIQN